MQGFLSRSSLQTNDYPEKGAPQKSVTVKNLQIPFWGAAQYLLLLGAYPFFHTAWKKEKQWWSLPSLKRHPVKFSRLVKFK